MGNVKGRVRQQDRPIESNNNQSATNKYNNFCTTQLKITTDKFFWMFKNFSGHEEKCGEYLQSTEFISKAPDGQLLKWEMRMYPNGRIEESNDYIAIFLYLTDSKNEEMEAKFQITIRKPNGDEFVLKPTEWRKYKPDTNGWGCDKMIKREDLLKVENGYLDGGQLTIVCSVTVKQKSVFLCLMFQGFWMVIITYLQHQDEHIEVYEEGTWAFVRGQLQTIDRYYGFGIDTALHHITDGHVAHHFFFTRIPHYNLPKATKAIRQVLEKYPGAYKRKSAYHFLLKFLWMNMKLDCLVGKGTGLLKYRSTVRQEMMNKEE